MATKAGKKTIAWIVLFGITGAVDGIQLLITLTGIGIFISEILEFIMPFILLGLLFVFGIPILNKPARLLSIIAVTFGDALSLGVAPFWVLDVYYLYRSVKNEEGQQDDQESQNAIMENNIRQPLYENGVRQQRNLELNPAPQPLNTSGVRRPNGGLMK